MTLQELRDDFDWRTLDSLAEMLAHTVGKTVADTVSHEVDRDRMYAEATYAVVFTDGTGFAVVTDAGWVGTDVTPGDPASVTYYALNVNKRGAWRFSSGAALAARAG